MSGDPEERRDLVVALRRGERRALARVITLLESTRADHAEQAQELLEALVPEATNAVRVHHQWLPDEIRIEYGLNQDTIGLLRQMGHIVAVKNAMGSTQSIMLKNSVFLGASDPRRTGALTLGF